MGIDAGFDMVPRLTKGAVDTHNWRRFIDFIKMHYKDDTQVEVKPNYINFKAGEHPMLPFEGHKFLRFSSKISGSSAARTGVESYISTVKDIAQIHFGSRIRSWDETVDELGIYCWSEVHESLRSYEQPDKVEIPTSIAQFLSGTDPIKELGIEPYEIKDIPGKGRGLVARLNISRGTQIIREKPLLTVQVQVNSQEELETLLVKKLKAMPKSSQRQFLSLHNNFPGKYAFSGVFKTNALPCGSGSSFGGVYPTACLINHSCIPNAHNSWNSNEEYETIYAIRPIRSGDEITISYDHGGPSDERKTFLKQSFCFTCTCSVCALPPSLLQTSDDRRAQIQSLDRAIGDPFRMMGSPQDSLRDCYILLQVLEQEFGDGAVVSSARLYYDAFQINIAHGDQARASIFAERAYRARVVCEGEENPETLRMKSLALNPANHSSFGVYSKKWKTTRVSIPKGLDQKQFDSWLFRQERI